MGASLVNDTSGLREDSRMAKLVADRAVPVVLMANCGEPCASAEASLESLVASVKNAMHAGVNPDQIILDPGIGFGKPTETDCAILRNLRIYSLLGRPLLVGVSRKAFIGELLGLPDPAERLTGTVAATSIAVLNGADIIRAHDVREARMATSIGEALRTPISWETDNIELLGLCNEREAELLIQQVGASAEITRQLASKALTLNILLRDVQTAAALILKQEMLAVGGDAAYHHDVIDHKTDRTDVLLLGSPLQLNKLMKRIMSMRDFGLADIGSRIRDTMSKRALNPR
jgi:dihydropteroate synthase